MVKPRELGNIEVANIFDESGRYNIVYDNSKFGIDVTIGSFCLLYPFLNLGHHIKISDRVTLGENPKEDLETRIGDNSRIFSGATIQAGVKAGERLVLATNAVIRAHSEIGDSVIIGLGSEIGANVKIGSDVKMNSHVFVPDYTIVEDHTYLGPYTVVTNTIHPRCPKVWECIPKTGVIIREYAKIGAGSVLLPGVEIGPHALVAAGSVIGTGTKVKPYAVMLGNPARRIKDVRELTCKEGINLVEGNPYQAEFEK